MNKKTLISGLALFFCTQCYAQEIMNRDSLVADFSYLVKTLEATHPDPYSGFGGKVFFHKQAYDLTKGLQNEDHTLIQFTDKVSSFLSNLQDGHTALYPSRTAERNKAGVFCIAAKVIPDGLIVSLLPSGNEAFLGSRIVGVNGTPIDSLLQIVSTMKGCENKYGQYVQLGKYLSHSDFLYNLFPDTKDTIAINVEMPDGTPRELPIPLVPKDKMQSYPTAKRPEWNAISTDAYMAYQFMDSHKDIMLLKLTHIMARENFEITLDNHWPGAYDQMKDFYKQTLKKEMPADTAKALQGIPSYSETFQRMLTEMKKQKSHNLIIDLRGNGGGWTPITLPTLYQLFGDKYLQTDMDTHFFRLISPLYLRKINSTLEEFNQKNNCDYKLGDYGFSETEKDTASIRLKREDFIINCMSDTKAELEKQQGKPVYTPEHIYVITDEWTFSAAFHYAFYLWKMGATIVGVPSMQAPNTFMEQTPFQLPSTRLEGSISNSIQVFLPAKDQRAHIFWPDLMPTYEDYKRYQFDKHSEIRFLLDKIK